MTVVCGGGASVARPGFGATVALGAGALGALLNNIPTPWAVPVAAYLGLITYELSTFCSTDPPAVPTFTAADIIAAISLADPVAHVAAIGKFADLIGAYAWYQFCECSTVATPSPPAAPAAPTGAPSINPILPTSGGPCGSWSINATIAEGTVPAHNSGLVALPSALSSVHVAFTGSFDHTPTANPLDAPLAFNWYSSAATSPPGATGFISQTVMSEHVFGALSEYTFTPPTGAAYMVISWQGVAGSVNSHWNIQATFTCGSGSGGVSTPTPCVTDPVVLALLQQILDLLTLVQRQHVPFGYIEGAVHSGLTGTGEIAVQGLLGVSILEISAPPPWIGEREGTPEQYFGLGYIQWGTNLGEWTQKERLVARYQISTPPNAGIFTRVAYTLSPGISINLTELRREH